MGLYICDGCGEHFDHRDSPCQQTTVLADPVCPDCFDDLSTCSRCLGTGIGQHGDPNASKCGVCEGTGSIDIEEPREPADFEPREDAA